MKVLAVDIGGKTRNGICLMDSDNLRIIECSYVPYESSTPYEHRRKVSYEVSRYIAKYKPDCMVFERVNLYRGGRISPLANIMSLCKIQTVLIDDYSQFLEIYDIAVKSWKSKAFNNGNAKKEDSLEAVKELYPEVNLNALVKHKRKKDEIVLNHDLADSIMIARACCQFPDLLNNKINFT